jgi:hypothetical protein
MSSLFFPQLSTGALVQYPVKRRKAIRVVDTESEDGSVIRYLDIRESTLRWELSYAGLTQDEVNALQALFDACCGPFRSFTFLDPTGNLLGPQWQYGAGIQMSGTTYTNTSNAVAEVSQTLTIPANYVYTFSVNGNIAADPGATLTLVRRGPSTEQHTATRLNQTSLTSSGALPDTGNSFTAALQLQPGQSISLNQAQLEAQPAASPFRPATGSIYPNAHWAQADLTFTADGPNSFSSKFTIETHV